MFEHELEIRMDFETGISFLGIDEINEALNAGKKITAIRQGSAIVDSYIDEEGITQYMLIGGKVIVSFS